MYKVHDVQQNRQTPVAVDGKRQVSTARRIVAIIMSMIQLALLVAALADLRRRPESEINGKKAVWMGVVFISFIGPISYFMFGRKRS